MTLQLLTLLRGWPPIPLKENTVWEYCSGCSNTVCCRQGPWCAWAKRRQCPCGWWCGGMGCWRLVITLVRVGSTSGCESFVTLFAFKVSSLPFSNMLVGSISGCETFVTLFAFETSSRIPLCDSFCHVAMCVLALSLRPKLSAKRKCNNTLTRGKVCSESDYNFSNNNKLRNHMQMSHTTSPGIGEITCKYLILLVFSWKNVSHIFV